MNPISNWEGKKDEGEGLSEKKKKKTGKKKKNTKQPGGKDYRVKKK